MFKTALAIVVISAAAATSVAAQASDWGNGAPHAAPGNERHWNNNNAQPRYPYHYAPPRYAAPRYVAPYRYAPAYRWAPPPYRWAPPHRVWYPGYAYRGYDDHRGYDGHRDYDDHRYCPDR